MSKISFLRLILMFFISAVGIYETYAQVESLPCQTEMDGFLGLDRKNWNGGSTVAHSEGSLHNFTLPANTFGDCKRIGNVAIEITAINADLSGLPADCPPPGAYYINIATSCTDFSPASCDVANLIAEPNTPNFINQSLSYTNPPEDFQFGDNLAIDIVPVMDVNCTNGQSALTNGSIVLDYEICVTVTIVDEIIDTPVNISGPNMACPVGTSTIAVGSYDQYEWAPGGETTQTIDVGPGTYNVTVTDANGCTDTDQIVILAFPDSPITFNPSAPTVCDGGSVSVSVNESYTSYAWSNTLTGQTVSLTEGMYEVTITDSNNCTAVNTVTVTAIPEPNAGSDNTETVCEGTMFDLNSLLSVDADAGGVFTDPSGSGSLTGSMVNTTGLAGQTINFIYTVGLPSDPCGEDQATLTLIIEAASEAGGDNTETVCDDIIFDLTSLLGATADPGGVFSDPAGTGSLAGSMVNTSTLGGQTINFLYTVGLPSDVCGTDVATLTLVVETAVDAGNDNSGSACDGDFFDLVTLLDAADAGGTFSDPSGSGSLTGSVVNTLGLGGQTINFIYEVGTVGGACGTDQATLTLTIDPFLFAGDDNSVTVCDGTQVNLNDLLDVDADLGGVFLDLAGTGILTGSTVNTTGQSGLSFDFIYEVGSASNSCGIDQATLTVIVEDAVDAGDDNAISVCEGNIVDLNNLLSADANAGGVFSDPLGTGTLSGSMVNTAGQAGESIDYIYTVGDAGDPCGEDQATLTITITTSLEAGDDNQVDLCLGGIIDLNDFLINADPGGTFGDTNGSGGLNGDMLNTDVIAPGTYIYDYSFFGGTCPFDIANIEITFSPSIENVFEIDTTELCFDVCQEINLSFAGDGPFTFDLEVENVNGVSQANTSLSSNTNNSTITLCNSSSTVSFASDTLNFSNLDSLVISLGNLQGSICDAVDTLWVNTLPKNEFLLDTTICILDTLFINDVELFLGNSSYIDTLPGVVCDSFININVSFSNIDTTYITETICAGDSVNYFSIWFDEDNANGEFPVANPSGCDSLFIVDITFYPEANAVIDTTLCPGDFIEVDGMIYDESNLSGTAVLEDASVFGCDSTITISLTYANDINIVRTDTLCTGDNIEIGGVVYDESNPVDQVLISGSGGCDTLIDINLTFVPPATNLIEGTYCSDFDTIVNGTIYNVLNPANTETIIGGSYLGCDSTITINLMFYPEANNLIDTSLCTGESLSVNGDVYDENNLIGTTIIENASQFGCDSIVNVSLTFFDVAESSLDTMLCVGDSIFLENMWQFDAGVYTDILTSASGCDSTITTTVSITPCNVDVVISSVGNNCIGDNEGSINVMLVSQLDLPYTIILTDVSTLLQTTIDVTAPQSDFAFDNLNSGVYEISIVESDGTIAFLMNEEVLDLFPALEGSWNLIDAILCNGDLGQLEFVTTGGLPDYSYEWSESTLGTDAAIDQITSGTYSVTVTDMNGCTFDSSFDMIEPDAITFELFQTDISCEGMNNGSVEISNIQGGDGSYTILVNDEVVNDLLITDLGAGNYTIVIEDSNGCAGLTENVVITESPNATLADYVLDYNIEIGDSVMIIGELLEDDLTFEWAANSSLSCMDCANPMASPNSTTIYNLTIINEMGCEQNVIITVTVDTNEDVLIAPNIFSPNGDGINDEFIFGGQQLLAIELTVFDRWGNVMHTGLSIDGFISWDGRSNSNELSPGVYVCQLALQYIDGTSEVRVSDITIVK